MSRLRIDLYVIATFFMFAFGPWYLGVLLGLMAFLGFWSLARDITNPSKERDEKVDEEPL